jgi:hypothetical protein
MSLTKSNLELQTDILFRPISFTPVTGTLVDLTIAGATGSETILGSTKFLQATIPFTSASATEAVGHLTFTFPTTTPFTSAPSIQVGIGSTTDTAVGWEPFVSTVTATEAVIYIRQAGTEATPVGSLTVIAIGEVA